MSRRPCFYCQRKTKYIQFYETESLTRYLNPQTNRVRPARETGVCAKHYRLVSRAIKNARMMAMLPYIKR